MRMDLSREEETKKLLSESVELVSMSASQKELAERIGCRVQHIKLNDFIKSSDIIISILPSTPNTTNFINKKFLRKMKKKSLLINVGRGTSVNEKDLISHLKSNKNFYASLDVFKEEPLSKKHPLWSLKNVIITPHIAGVTVLDSAIEQIHNRWLQITKTGIIKNDVNLKKGY